MTAPALDFTHRFVPAAVPGRAPLLLLHGTGGDENDLMPLGKALSPGAALLSPRGLVSEGGMPRFFRRLAEGVFDPVEVRHRAAELAGFVMDARGTYGLDAPVAVGFSNGANIAAVLLALHPGTLGGAVLLRPMSVLDDPGLPATVPVLMVSGSEDPIVPVGSARALVDRLRAAGATVEHDVIRAGHGLTGADLDLATAWLRRQSLRQDP